MTEQQQTVDPEDDVLDTAAMAEFLGVSVDWVQRQCAAGNLPAKKLGRGYKSTRAALRKFMADTAPVKSTRDRRGSARQRRRSAT